MKDKTTSVVNVTLFNDPKIINKNNTTIEEMMSEFPTPSFQVTFWALQERYKSNRPMGRPLDPPYDLTKLLIDPATNLLYPNPMGLIVNALRSYMNKAKFKDVDSFVLRCSPKQ